MSNVWRLAHEANLHAKINWQAQRIVGRVDATLFCYVYLSHLTSFWRHTVTTNRAIPSETVYRWTYRAINDCVHTHQDQELRLSEGCMKIAVSMPALGSAFGSNDMHGYKLYYKAKTKYICLFKFSCKNKIGVGGSENLFILFFIFLVIEGLKGVLALN